MKSAIERIDGVAVKLTPYHRERSQWKYSQPFVSVIITRDGYHPSIEHGDYGQLPEFEALDEALAALEQFADRLAYADDLVAKTLGIAS